MRLIDADETIQRFTEWQGKCAIKGTYLAGAAHQVVQWCIESVNAQPTIEPVKRGKWECDEDDFVPTCSECGKAPLVDGFSLCLSPYCPHCGAKMDGEGNA